MPRDLVVGNGTLLVNIDRNLNIRDLYFPHVGQHNHVSGYFNRVGVWVDGQFAWLDNTWSIKVGYRPRSLTTEAHALNGRLGIAFKLNDTVHPELNIFLRRVEITNQHPDQREIRVFFGHDFRIYENDIGDTAFFHPFTGSMVHFKRDCYILVNGRINDEGIFEYAAGVKGFGGAEGTWRDAEDGSLSMHPVEQGSVDSTISFRTDIKRGDSAILDYWIAVGRSLDEVTNLNNAVGNLSVKALLTESDNYWTSWLDVGTSLNAEFPPSVANLYERSLLVMQTQIDRCGGILAANDTDILETARAHYSYVWPRDGAFVAHALDLAGYRGPARRFLSFCASILPMDRPFFLQKYCPDGTVGATWHPWVANGEADVPCQQDSTALVLWAVGKHYDRWKDKEFANSMYGDLVAPAADYMVSQLDQATKLPRPSYDLWEQRKGVHLFTCCAVYGALSAATKLAHLFDPEKAEPYREAKNKLKRAIIDRFIDIRVNRFVRSLISTPGGQCDKLVADPTIDASMSGLFLFDLLPASDQRVVSTMGAVYDRLWVRTPVGGLARYEDDYYFQVSSDVKLIPGNPWFVSTLWIAEWYVEVAKSIRDLEPALDLLAWAARHASEAGLLAEQIDPFTSKPLSVMPLTWSHAAFVSAALKYQAKLRRLTSRKANTAGDITDTPPWLQE